MADNDKAREIARIIKNSPPDITLSPENVKILADGFLALDKLLETHPPSEKPEKYLDVLICDAHNKYHIGRYSGFYDSNEAWPTDDEGYLGTKDIKHWQYLPTDDKNECP